MTTHAGATTVPAAADFFDVPRRRQRTPFARAVRT